MTPIQFQKQFSREYRRMFGVPPSRDALALRKQPCCRDSDPASPVAGRPARLPTRDGLQNVRRHRTAADQMTGVPVTISTHREDAVARRVRWLVTATITYNVVEAVVALAAGAIAWSIALLGFGLDSVVEITSAAAVAWQFAARDHGRRQARERTALRLIAVSFFALAVFVIVDAVRAMAAVPRLSTPGSASCSPPSHSWSCPCCRSRNAMLVGNSAQPQPWPTPNKPSCAPICPAYCYSG
jgi:hypothetical protein